MTDDDSRRTADDDSRRAADDAAREASDGDPAPRTAVDPDRETTAPDREPTEPRGSSALTYGPPFLGTLLVALGLAGAVVGGYAFIQAELGLCGDPTVVVYSPEATDQLTAERPAGPNLERFAFPDLAPAEQRAVESAVRDPADVGEVEGRFVHRAAFERGVLVDYRGATRYATVTSTNACLAVNPLLFPLGVVSILLGVVGILVPPIYRRLLALEAQSERSRQE